MNLIEEVEDYLSRFRLDGRSDAAYIPYWNRIKAALEAAQEMETCLDVYHKLAGGGPRKAQLALIKFRKAMNGKDA